jgi:hypothetical protein
MKFLLGIILGLVFLILGLSSIVLNQDYVKAQQANDLKDPNQLIKEFKDGKDTLQNELVTNFDQLLNVIKAQLNFDSVDSTLSLASQYFAQGKISEGQMQLQQANVQWQNTTKNIVNTGNEISSIAKNDSLSLTNSTREIMDHLGKIFVDMGAKAENLRIKLAS